MISRRAFLETVSAAIALFRPWVGRPAPANEWGSPVFDLHFHMRPQPAATSRTSTARASPRRIC